MLMHFQPFRSRPTMESPESINGRWKPNQGAKRATFDDSPNLEDDGDHTLVSPANKRPRSDDLVRVTYADEPGYRNLVRRTRITYDSLRSLVAFGERNLTPGRRQRADLEASSRMKRLDLWMHRDKRIIGSIPGIRIGDVFFYRAELMVVGLHGRSQGGIDYVSCGDSNCRVPVATSIVSSGGYEDNIDQGDVIIYSGSGGREKNAASNSAPQRLAGGNLALEKSREFGIEIRVVRGFDYDRSPSNRVYVYDGLYKVTRSWMDPGKSGFEVCKFELRRIPIQEERGSAALLLAEDLKTQILKSKPKGYLSTDISEGQEQLPVSLYNDIDDDKNPLSFDYIRKPHYPPIAFQETLERRGWNWCKCVDNCSRSCACAKRNGGECAYDGNGLLLRGKPLIYECGVSCRCPLSCPNRASQKGLRHRLEVFRSSKTGWGLRSLDVIRAGEFVCEFSGKVLTMQQREEHSNGDDSLVYPSVFPRRWEEWGDISDITNDYKVPDFPPLPELSFALDVSKVRNVACYLSHSSMPNVFVQQVLYDHYNELYPHLMVFAMENIPPFRELSLDYGVEMAAEPD